MGHRISPSVRLPKVRGVGLTKRQRKRMNSQGGNGNGNKK